MCSPFLTGAYGCLARAYCCLAKFSGLRMSGLVALMSAHGPLGVSAACRMPAKGKKGRLAKRHFCFYLLLFHLQPLTGAVAVELGGVHALDIRDAGLIAPAMEHFYRILEHVSAFGQVVDEEMA